MVLDRKQYRQLEELVEEFRGSDRLAEAVADWVESLEVVAVAAVAQEPAVAVAGKIDWEKKRKCDEVLNGEKEQWIGKKVRGWVDNVGGGVSISAVNLKMK